MFYVYFLELANGHIYVGSTNNLRNRVSLYESGKVNSTKNLLPIKLRSYVAVETDIKARELEKYFKTGSGKAILKKRFLT